MSVDATLWEIKKRLQAQQESIISAHADSGTSMANLLVRAEHDAIWACLHVIAQTLDGSDVMDVPDFYGDRPS